MATTRWPALRASRASGAVGTHAVNKWGEAKAVGHGGQRSMAAMFASSWRSPEAGVRSFKRSS